jgi:hypothetical protein
MAVTRLERKGRKNKNVAKKRVATIQRLSSVPVIKNVDVDAIKKEFDAKKLKSAAKGDKAEKKVSDKLEKKVSVKAEKIVKAKKIDKTNTPKVKKSEK